MIKYYLDKNNYKKCDFVIDQYLILPLEVMNESQADDFLKLQTEAASEIDEEINILPKKGLIEKSPYRSKNLFFYLVFYDKSLVGYGYSHEDSEEKGICKINTIFLKTEHRGTGLSEFLVRRIIEHNLDFQESLIGFKAITQIDNKGAIKILDNLLFKNEAF